MKKFILALLVLSTFTFGMFSKDAEAKPAEILQAVAQASWETLPSQVDEYTILFGIGADKLNLIYSYALKGDATAFPKATLDATIKPALISGIKDSTDEAIIYLKNLKVTFVHRYYGIDGKLITEIKITPKDYQ